jgi:hypothetical protein
MPRGVYDRKSSKTNAMAMLESVIVKYESDDMIAARISERFEVLKELTDAVTSGETRSLIVSGPAGLGKSYSVERALASWDPSEDNHTFVKGFVRATGLYKILYQYRESGQVIVFDDADAIFFDDNALNLLKAVCDTTETRKVSWLAETNMVDAEGVERIPRSFTFNGSIIFITNLDFDQLIERGHKLAPHLEALVSRSHYIDLAMKSRNDYLIRIRQVVKQGLLNNMSAIERDDVIQFIEANSDKLRELSLRMAIKLANVRKTNPTNWRRTAHITCCKNT